MQLEIVFRLTEAVYLMLLLPLSCYEPEEVANFAWTSVTVAAVGLAQVAFLYSSRFAVRQVQHFLLIYKSLGYWVEAGSDSVTERSKKDIFVWEETMSPKFIEKRFIVIFGGQIYLKVLKNISYFMINNKKASLIDILILVR